MRVKIDALKDKASNFAVNSDYSGIFCQFEREK